MPRLLITGAAGFIAYHVSEACLQAGFDVVGLDHMNAYYALSLKQKRIERLRAYHNFQFEQLDLNDMEGMRRLFKLHHFDLVLHFAAQAGVRHSADHPEDFTQSNLLGFASLLEVIRMYPKIRLIFASSSSVYGNRNVVPFREDEDTSHPESYYAATKKANEVMAFSYHQWTGIPMIGLRFFSVIGPWGRPDMAYFKFTQAILNHQSLNVYGQGLLERDYTDIRDVCEAILIMVKELSWTGYEIINIGHGQPISIHHMIEILENHCQMNALLKYVETPFGDVRITYADNKKLKEKFGYEPKHDLDEGLQRFVEWYIAEGKDLV